MSQDKTKCPGMNEAESFGRGRKSSSFAEPTNNRRTRGTVFPGMEEGQDERAFISGERNRNKPIVGFLYSVTRTEYGEYWPLYIGQNTIGSSSNCDIYLPEATVSEAHAEIVIRKMKKPEKIIASISDAKSTNGTMRNGESLGFTAVDCFNGDILTFGECYELLLILIDVKELGLKLSDSFMSLDDNPDFQDAPMDGPSMYNRDNVPPRFNPGNNHATNGTVPDNSNGASFGQGSTEFMN